MHLMVVMSKCQQIFGAVYCSCDVSLKEKGGADFNCARSFEVIWTLEVVGRLLHKGGLNQLSIQSSHNPTTNPPHPSPPPLPPIFPHSPCFPIGHHGGQVVVTAVN
ncbi:hypothetical protein ACTXT7_009655 [Hymenolepis weldensis]